MFNLYSMEDMPCVVTCWLSSGNSSGRKTYITVPGTIPEDLFQAYFNDFGHYPTLIEGMVLDPNIWAMTEEFYRNQGYTFIGE